MSDFEDTTDFDQSNTMPANPNRYRFLDSLSISDDVTRRLSLHLDRIVSGNNEVYLTPLGKNVDPKVILSRIDSIIAEGDHLLSLNLKNLESSNRAKFGPRSIAKPWTERFNDVKKYFEDTNVPSTVSVPLTYKGNLRPISVENASKYLKPNTNSGLPDYAKKKTVVQKLVENFDEYIGRNSPCILFTRTQEIGKTRTVWGFPIADTLRELTVYVPLLSLQKTLPWRTALLGPDAVDASLSKFFSELLVDDSLTLVSIDFSTFDATVKNRQQESAFNYIRNQFQKSHESVINDIANRFNTIGILTPSGVMSGQHGVPSGSTFTNEVDSIVQHNVSSHSGASINRKEIQGDDGSYLMKSSDVGLLFKSFLDNGLVVNIDKSYVSRDFCVYLQRLYDVHYYKDGFVGGIYPIYRAINRLVYQERYSNFEDFDLTGIDYYSIRAITILENVKYHPLFKELVKLVYELDKYKLKFSSKAVVKYDNMLKNGSGTGGFMYNQFGDNVSGIYSFETYKLISTFG
uniref:RdRp n=1 Tax=Hubei picobirna-like virus 2 TaxID=1923085 RepID=A0A1L3KLW2_9VIRU|nr:RdRp [Hubei picobirna-like virus 2]